MTIEADFEDVRPGAYNPHARLKDLEMDGVVGELSITLDIYSHVTPGLQEAAALRFDEGLSRKEKVAEEVPINTAR